MKRLLCLFVCIAALLQAADTDTAYVPSADTTVTTRNVRLYDLYLANVTGGAVTVTITDRSTNCNGAGCALWPTVSIAANSVYTVQMRGVQANSGFNWHASAANSVVGNLSYQ